MRGGCFPGTWSARRSPCTPESPGMAPPCAASSSLVSPIGYSFSESSLTSQYKPSGSETPGIGSLPAVSRSLEPLGAGRAPGRSRGSCTRPCLVSFQGWPATLGIPGRADPRLPSLPPSPPRLPLYLHVVPGSHKDTHHWICPPPQIQDHLILTS